MVENDSTCLGCALVSAGVCGQVQCHMVARHQQRTWLDMLRGSFAATLRLELRNLVSWKGSKHRDWGCDAVLVRTPGWVTGRWAPTGTNSFPRLGRGSADVWTVPFGMCWEIKLFILCRSFITITVPPSSATAPAAGVDNLRSYWPLFLGSSSCIPARLRVLKKPFPPSAVSASSPSPVGPVAWLLPLPTRHSFLHPASCNCTLPVLGPFGWYNSSCFFYVFFKIYLTQACSAKQDL